MWLKMLNKVYCWFDWIFNKKDRYYVFVVAKVYVLVDLYMFVAVKNL